MSRRRGAADTSRLFAQAAEQAPAVVDVAAQLEERSAQAGPVQRIAPATLRPSPFQPAGRPSPIAVEAVRQAAAAAGSLALLVARDAGEPADGQPVREFRHPAFKALSPEARDLAELAGDVARNGVTEPLDVRAVPPDDDGRTLELVSGHRRRAAALLAGLADVPVRSLGTVPDAEAAALVFARNRLRSDFGPFHEAQALATLRGLRGGTLHALSSSLGYSHARAGILLQAAAAFDDATRAELAGGDLDAGTAAVARLSYRQLRDLVPLAGDRSALLRAARSAAKLEAPAPVSTAVEALAGGGTRGTDDTEDDTDGGTAAPPIHRAKRAGGGFVLTIARTPADVTAEDAASIAAELERLAAQYRRAEKRAGRQ